MLPKPSGCTGCPMEGDGTGFVPDEIVPGAKAAVWLQNPGVNEEREGRPAIGDTGDILNEDFLPVAGLTRSIDVSVCNALRCRYIDPVTGKKVNKLPPPTILNAALTHCRQYDRPHAGVNIAAGAAAWKAFEGPGSITDWRGFKHPTKPVIATLHPADLFRDPKMKLAVLYDWHKVKAFQAGTWPQPVPPYEQIRQESIERFFTFTENTHRDQPPWIVIDTEYIKDTKYLTVLGITYPNAPFGVQCWMQDIDGYGKKDIRAHLISLIRRHKVVFHNAMADIPVLERSLGISYEDYRAGIDDTMLLHAVLWSDWPHTLEFLASVYGKHEKMKHLSVSNPSLYNWGDCIDTDSSMQAMWTEAGRDPLVRSVYLSQSLPLVPIILKRMARGLRVNKERVLPAFEQYTALMAAAATLGQSAVGWPINIGSDDQLKAYCYDFRKYPIQKHKETKKPTTDGDAIAALRTFVGPLPDLEEEEKNGLSLSVALARIEQGADPVLEARVIYAAAEQTLSHYLTPLRYVERIYPEYKIHAQASGRWSITNPPLGQLPDDLRDIIMPDVGEAWVSYDSDQIELRISAALAQDEPYLIAFEKDWDVHTLNMCDCFELPYPPNRVNPWEQPENAAWLMAYRFVGKQDVRRVFAKRFVYRLNYGGYAGSSGDIPGARQLGLDKAGLIRAANRYLSAHPAMLRWREETAQELRKTGVSRTFMGRRRRLERNTQAGLREAYNHPLQGGAADILNITTIRIAQALPYATLAYTMHDSATWAVPIEKAAEAQQVMQGIIDEPWNINGVMVKLPAAFKKVVYGAT